jgi:hypothetical protein
MKKNKLFLFLSIITLVLIFGIAAICNFCGTPVEVGVETTDEEQGSDSGIQPEHSSSSSSGQSSQGTSGNADDAEPGNNPPEIIEIELWGANIELYEREGLFDIVPLNSEDDPDEVYFEIVATDRDGDELEYRAFGSRGDEFEVTKINNNSADFFWIIPFVAGQYTLTIEVTDGRGGRAVRDIEMTIVLEEMEFIPLEEDSEEEESGEAMGESLRGFRTEDSLCGQVAEDGTVFMALESSGAPVFYVGDTVENIRIQGFISFNVSEIAGSEVIAAWFNISGTRIGDPLSYPETYLHLYHSNYGGSLGFEDFDIVIEPLAYGPLDHTDFSFTNDNLKDAVQRVLNAGDQYFQMSLLIPASSDNRSSDGFNFLLSNISLEVSYR